MIVFAVETDGRSLIKIGRGLFVDIADLDGPVQERIETRDRRAWVVGSTRRGSAAFDFLSRKEKADLLRKIREADAGRLPGGEVMFREISNESGRT